MSLNSISFPKHIFICLTPEQRLHYISLAKQSWQTAWEILHDEHGWSEESGSSLKTTGRVVSKTYQDIGKVYKLHVGDMF